MHSAVTGLTFTLGLIADKIVFRSLRREYIIRVNPKMSTQEVASYVTCEDFQYYWQRANERIQSSYSGPHFGHYKLPLLTVTYQPSTRRNYLCALLGGGVV